MPTLFRDDEMPVLWKQGTNLFQHAAAEPRIPRAKGDDGNLRPLSEKAPEHGFHHGVGLLADLLEARSDRAGPKGRPGGQPHERLPFICPASPRAEPHTPAAASWLRIG